MSPEQDCGGDRFEREREMYRLRVDEGMTLRQIGQRYGLSVERVRQLLNVYLHRFGEQQPLVELGRAVREAREQRGISPEQLAHTTGIAARRIRALERGRFDPPLDLLFALAEGLGMELSALICLVERAS